MMELRSCCILFFWGSNISTHQKKPCQVLIPSSALQGQARSVPSLFAVNCYSYSMVIFPLAFLQLFSSTCYKGAWTWGAWTCVRKNGTELSTNRVQECEKVWKSALLVRIELVFMIKKNCKYATCDCSCQLYTVLKSQEETYELISLVTNI